MDKQLAILDTENRDSYTHTHTKRVRERESCVCWQMAKQFLIENVCMDSWQWDVRHRWIDIPSSAQALRPAHSGGFWSLCALRAVPAFDWFMRLKSRCMKKRKGTKIEVEMATNTSTKKTGRRKNLWQTKKKKSEIIFAGISKNKLPMRHVVSNIECRQTTDDWRLPTAECWVLSVECFITCANPFEWNY